MRKRNIFYAAVGGYVAGLSLLVFALASAANGTTQACTDLGTRLGGMAISSGSVCDVVLVRQSPSIIGHNGQVLNKFTLMNSVIEFAPTATSTATSTFAGGAMVHVVGDFALLETELNTVLRLLTSYGWTVTGIHNHMIQETPKLTFVHWEAMGTIDDIVNRVRTIVGQTSIQPGTGTSTSTPPGTPTSTATSTTGRVNLKITKHLCPATIQQADDIVNRSDRRTLCPAILKTGDSPAAGTVGGGIFDFQFAFRARSATGTVSTISTSPVLERRQLCTGGVCHDASMYVWSLPRTDVTITETVSPTNARFGLAELEGDEGQGILISAGEGLVNLNTRSERGDGNILLHIYNFRR